MNDTNKQKKPNDNKQGTTEKKGGDGGVDDTLGGQPQSGQEGEGSNSILIVLLILIVFVIGFLLFSGDTAESPTDQPPQATTTEQPADADSPATNTEPETDESTTSPDVETEASATGSVDVQ